MVKIGFHASHEQWPPSRLLEHLRRAEKAGFAAAMCSDHFYPWTRRQGESGYAWSWLGAALQATNLSLGTVCAPGQRYHPAIVAQSAATLAEMFPGRFWLAVGSGEALNERITGDPWPSKDERNQRLLEAADVIRALWRGETVEHAGTFRVHAARLYTRPTTPPLLIGAAVSEESARWVGRWADGLITVGKDAAHLRNVCAAFRDGGGAGKPIYLQSTVSFAASDEEALQMAYNEWPQCALESDQLADLERPEDFEAAIRNVTPAMVARCIRISADLQQHIAWLQEDVEIGFAGVYLHYVGRNVEQFIDAFAEHVLPAIP